MFWSLPCHITENCPFKDGLICSASQPHALSHHGHNKTTDLKVEYQQGEIWPRIPWAFPVCFSVLGFSGSWAVGFSLITFMVTRQRFSSIFSKNLFYCHSTMKVSTEDHCNNQAQFPHVEFCALNLKAGFRFQNVRRQIMNKHME